MPRPGSGSCGVAQAHVAEHDGLAAYAPQAWGRAIAGLVSRLGPPRSSRRGASARPRRMAHAAAITDLPLAANCVAAAPGDPAAVTRVRWGGSLLEEARLHGATKLLTVAPHAVEAQAAAAPATTEVETLHARAGRGRPRRAASSSGPRPTRAAASRSPTRRSS